MSRFIPYNPDQAMLLPPSVREELGEEHLAVFLHELVEKLDLGEFEGGYQEEGRPAYPPQLQLKVWLYAYALGLTSSRRIEQRLHEDLGFRFLAGGHKPDHWTLNEFRKKHPTGINDVFTQVLEAARELGLAQLGRVAIDSTRIEANASPNRADSIRRLRAERARLRRNIRRWQQDCNRDDEEPSGGTAEAPAEWRKRLEEIPRQLEQLRKSGQHRGSRTDPESRYLRTAGGFCLGYTGELAVSDDHFIVAQRVHQAPHDTASLEPMTRAVRQRCGSPPERVLADSGYYAMPQILAVEQQGIEVLVPDKLMAREIAGGQFAPEMNERQQRRTPGLKQLRERLRDPTTRACYARRKALVEPVFGVLKHQRGMRKFRCRSLHRVETEWTLSTTAFNITRLFRLRAAG